MRHDEILIRLQEMGNDIIIILSEQILIDIPAILNLIPVTGFANYSNCFASTVEIQYRRISARGFTFIDVVAKNVHRFFRRCRGSFNRPHLNKHGFLHAIGAVSNDDILFISISMGILVDAVDNSSQPKEKSDNKENYKKLFHLTPQ